MGHLFNFEMVLYLLCKEYGLKPEVVAQYCVEDIIKEASAVYLNTSEGGQMLEAARAYIKSEGLVDKIKKFEADGNRA